jgi:acetolactate synthase-1/3 small subunit
LQALVAVLEPFGIRELVQSGMVGLSRGGRSIAGSEPRLRAVERPA